GLSRLRVPAEPPWVLRRCGARLSVADYMLYGWTRVLRFQARHMAVSDHVFGLKWSGHMTAPRLGVLLRHLPPGVTEIYVHPATARDDRLCALMPDYEHVEEFAALMDLELIDRG
ncbi:MAG: ChbG/HpnK family deacetylase, partial [Acidocella sp.]|nr:ChbG/HpnK family deacetylase [Acidocella sp.]